MTFTGSLRHLHMIPAKRSNSWRMRAIPRGLMPATIIVTRQSPARGRRSSTILREVGIRAQLRPLERAAFFQGWADKKFKTIVQGWSGAFGNVATRLQAFVVAGGTYAYGSYSDLDELYRRQATELDRNQRATILTEIQRDLYDRAMFAPIWQLGVMVAVGPRVAESGLGLIPGFPFAAPYEDITLMNR